MIRADNNKFDLTGIHNKYADYVFVYCKNCMQQYIYDAEHCVLYINPINHNIKFYILFNNNDLIKRYPTPCVGCKESDWDFEYFYIEDIDKVIYGPWNKYLKNT